jgi:hypothetical protein
MDVAIRKNSSGHDLPAISDEISVWAADGGQRVSAPPPTRECGSFLFARHSTEIIDRHG